MAAEPGGVAVHGMVHERDQPANGRILLSRRKRLLQPCYLGPGAVAQVGPGT